jgi:glycosyltransferase involved in cell wall biosynthesis
LRAVPAPRSKNEEGLRIAVYTDYAYHRRNGEVYAERAFALFLAELSRRVGRLVVIGRLDPGSEGGHYRVGSDADFAPLPHYPSLASPLSALRGMAGSLRRYWRALDGVDAVWILGPHPLALPFALIAGVRGKSVRLGVRQDTRAYLRARRGRNPLVFAAGWALEGSFRLLARRCPTVVVGPGVARNYRHGSRVLEIAVSLVREAEIAAPAELESRSYAGELTALSVGRLEAEKNPLILAETLALLRRSDPRWRLVVCGEGPMAAELAARLEQLGLTEHAELRGYVPLGDGLSEIYRSSSVLFHASWTEGLPQVLFEAFAAALPVVATDVGGIREAVGDAVRLIPAGDAEAAARELERVAKEPELRRKLADAGNALVLSRTLESEAARVARFLR